MALFLEIASGDLKGTKFPVREGYKLGRASGEIIIPDKKVSGLHAQVKVDSKGQFVLVDQGSSNGLIINGQKVRRLAMLPGVMFQVGRTALRVVQGEESTEPTRVIQRSWREILVWEARKLGIDKNSPNPDIVGFAPALRLSFLSGPNAETELLLGWGPRLFGSNTLDIELLEPNIPPVAFMIRPDPAGAMIQTEHSHLVLLNQMPAQSNILHERDLLKIGSTNIEVHYQ
jgi:hypothetical protein